MSKSKIFYLVFLIICSLFLIFSCELYNGSSSSDDGGSSSGNDDDDSSSTADAAEVASDVVTNLSSINLELPQALSSGGSRLDIDYDSLDDVPSMAYEQLLNNIEQLSSDAESISSMFDMLKEAIDDGLEENTVQSTVYTGEGPDGYGTYNAKMKYSLETVGGVDYIVFLGGSFDDDDELLGACYIEATIDEEDNVSGQAMFNGSHEHEGTLYHCSSKIKFDTETDIQEAYHYEYPDGDEENGKGGMMKITPDADDSDNGVYIATNFNGDFGEFIEMGWANDNYGGVQNWGSWSDESRSSSDNEGIYSEYFVMSGGEAKICYRQWGDKSTQHIFWGIYQARNNGSDFSGYMNFFDDSAEIDEAPEYITIVRTGDNGFDVYAGEYTASDYEGTAIYSTSENTDDIWNLFWLDTTGDDTTEVIPGDAEYRFYNWSENEGNTVQALTFKRAVVVPETTSRFGKNGFYVQDMYPLLYVTGDSSNNTTLIQYDYMNWDGDASTNEEWEKITFFDMDGDGEYDAPGDVDKDGNYDGDGVTDKELMVWSMEEWGSNSSTTWLFGVIPTFEDGDGNSLTYTYATEKAAVDAKFANIVSTDYISTVTYPEFPVNGNAFPVITGADFE